MDLQASRGSLVRRARRAFSDLDPARCGRVQALVLTGYGLNCEAETQAAFACLGVATTCRHIADALASARDGGDPFDSASILAFIGGFSFGDHVASGRILANRMRDRAGRALARFVDRGGLVIGICNGFQTIVKLGLLPAIDRDPGDALAPQQVSLVANERLGYRNQWVTMAVDPASPCVWTRGIGALECPSRHGEGRLVLGDATTQAAITQHALIPLRYVDAGGEATQAWPANPNGSPGGAAALCDRSGRIFGVMPHPEAHLHPECHPQWRRRRAQGEGDAVGEGLAIFANGVRAALAM